MEEQRGRIETTREAGGETSCGRCEQSLCHDQSSRVSGDAEP
jgi:hypothetical protein